MDVFVGIVKGVAIIGLPLIALACVLVGFGTFVAKSDKRPNAKNQNHNKHH